MRTIELSRGLVTLVDDEDFDAISGFKWTAVVTGKHIKRPYAYRRAGWDNAARRYTETLYLHRVILGAPRGCDVDHINGDTLDNRRANLRLASRGQNLANSRRALGASGFRGVRVDERDGRVYAYCRGYLGCFPTKEDAARAYDAAALKEFGEFAKVNFPHELARNGREHAAS